MFCLTAAAVAATLAVQTFTLSWVHSVQRSEIQEDYGLAAGRLILIEARIKGSAAGFDPPPGAVLDDGWWRWRPGTLLDSVTLARASAPGEWRICLGSACQPLNHYLTIPDDRAARIAPCS